MQIKSNGVYNYNGKMVKVIQPQGFRTIVRSPKEKSFSARADLLHRSSATLEDFRAKD